MFQMIKHIHKSLNGDQCFKISLTLHFFDEPVVRASALSSSL